MVGKSRACPRHFAVLLALVMGAPAAFAQQAPEPRPLTAGQAVADSVAPGALHAFTLDLEADRFVYGAVDQVSVDVVVTIVDPAGERVGEFDSPARGPEPFHFVSSTAGAYRIEVRPFEGAAGRYSVAVERVEARASTPEGRVDQIMAPYTGERPGGVVAVVRKGEVVFARGYGMADLEHDAPNRPSTPWHMASVSKQFTAFAIALLAERGELSLEDDIRKHIPELHDFGSTITLRHLANHTSGLRDHWTLWVMSGGLMDDVIRQEDLLRLAYDQRELNFEPGSEYAYSNTGYMLLSEVVERVTGEPFGDWMRENVFAPLGMHDTQIYDDHTRIVEGRAYSYENGENGIRKAVLSYANAGATSLFTTAEDLARWVRNMRTHAVGGPAVWEEMTTRGVLTSGDTIDYALGLGIGEDRGLRIISHGGADAGYRTILTYYPELDAAVIALGNVASFNPGQVGQAVARAFFEESMDPAEEPENGAEPIRRATPWTPGADDLATYAGRYYSPELETFYTVRFDDEGELIAWHRRHGEIALTPASPDEFSSDRWFIGDVRFELDDEGTVTGMRMSSGRVRNLLLQKVGGGG